MKHQTQTTPDTKAGTSSNSSADQAAVKEEMMTLDDLSKFENLVSMRAAEAVKGVMPQIEAPLRVIEHFNRGEKMMKGFQESGYFVYKGVKVFEIGKVHDRDSRNMEQILFGLKSAG